jgi:murein L,D-transpeptidase YcbB/YkuD
LGTLVFHFQNIYNAYLNQNPDQNLFEKDKRDLSNGCIWIDRAVDLAALLLKYDGPGQTGQLYKNLKKSKTQNFVLNKPVPLIITYLTCEIKKSEIVSYGDVYHMDEILETAIYNKKARNMTMQ